MPSYHTNNRTGIQPTVPTASEFFARVMGSIEPDLLLSTIERKTKYADETSTEHDQRMKRYQSAFQRYRMQRTEALRKLRTEADAFVHALFTQAEEQLSSQEQEALGRIEAEISKNSA